MSQKSVMNVSFKSTAYVLISIFGFLALLYFGRNVLVPLAFSLLIAFILYPVCVWLERKGVGRLWSILWTMVAVTFLIVGITALFSAQIVDIAKEFDSFSQRLNELLVAVAEFTNQNISFIPTIGKESIIDKAVQWLSSESGGMLTNTLNSTALFITGLMLTAIYSFLILLHRKAFRKAFMKFAPEGNQTTISDMIKHIQKVGQQYLTGMFTLILILGALNSLGLFLIGIDYALFFGFLAGFLAIIPYVGTVIGGALPAIYAFMNYDSYWYPLGVILVFWFVQLLEGNVLNPKIVGGSLNINALASILALITGGFIWGIAGMILFLPYVAILKVACEYFDNLKPIGMLLRDDVVRHEGSGKQWKTKIKKLLNKD